MAVFRGLNKNASLGGWQNLLDRVQFWQMRNAITVRLPDDVAKWLEETSARTGVPRGELVRDQLQKAKENSKTQSFMRLAGCVHGPKDLSKRKGFSK